MKGFEVYGQNDRRRPGQAEGAASGDEPSRSSTGSPTSRKGDDATYALWENFLECVRDRNRETLSTPELGAAAFSDGEHGRAELPPGQGAVLGQGGPQAGRSRRLVGGPVGAAVARARQAEPGHRLEGRRQRQRLHPPDYQKLEGPWVDGKDPAEASGGR